MAQLGVSANQRTNGAEESHIPAGRLAAMRYSDGHQRTLKTVWHEEGELKQFAQFAI